MGLGAGRKGGLLSRRFCWRVAEAGGVSFCECGEGMVWGRHRIRFRRSRYRSDHRTQQTKARKRSRLGSSDESASALGRRPLELMGFSRRSRIMFRYPDTRATRSYSLSLAMMSLRLGKTLLPALTFESSLWRSCASGERFPRTKGQGRNADS